jgi:tripartite-type tricarboxylate transporter receptor subunit TctC
MHVVVRPACRTALATVLAIGLLAIGVPAQGADSYYAGKQVKLYVGSAPGGGYDILSRLVAAHIGRHLPGNPTVIVQNAPGAASRTVTTWIYTSAPKDGTAFASVFSSIPTDQLLDPTAVKFDPRKFTWLGSASRDTAVGIVWHTASVQTLEELKTNPMIVGSSGGITFDFPTVVREILGLKFNVIAGYKGTNEIGLAMERGEVDGNAGLIWASVKAQNQQWLREKKLRVFVQYGRERDSELPDVPLLYDLVANPADRQAFDLVFARLDFSRPYIAPPDMPKERARMLRQAFEATIKDEAFIAEAGKRKMDISLVPGAEMEKIVAKLYDTPDQIVARVRGILSPGTKAEGK